jgi:hypothetical protein
MKEITVGYTGADGAAHGSTIADLILKVPDEYVLVLGILTGLAVALMTIFGTRRILNFMLPDIGSGNSEIDKDFSAELGINDGLLAGLPVKCNWIPVVRGRHPALLSIDFTVRNPRGARMCIHREGVFSRPLGSLPAQVQAPPQIASNGYLLRLEPPDALQGADAKLDEAMGPVCAAGLYETTLEAATLSVTVYRNVTFELEESRRIFAQAASLFN